jgi:hypothetical protein
MSQPTTIPAQAGIYPRDGHRPSPVWRSGGFVPRGLVGSRWSLTRSEALEECISDRTGNVTWSQRDCDRLTNDEVRVPAGLQRLQLLLDTLGRLRVFQIRIELEHRAGDVDRVLVIAQCFDQGAQRRPMSVKQLTQDR